MSVQFSKTGKAALEGAVAAHRGESRRLSASDIVITLREEIASLRYVEHDRLPAERELAARFEVARGTVRAALDRLAHVGLVEKRGKSGTYVRYSQLTETQSVIRSTGPMQLIDARLAVEPHVTRLAALHATGNAIYELERALRKVERCRSEEEGFSAADESFHREVAACTRNEMLIWISKWINQVRGHGQWTEMKRLTLAPAVISTYNMQHRTIYEAIRGRDADAAAKAATVHLLRARDSLVDAGARQAP